MNNNVITRFLYQKINIFNILAKFIMIHYLHIVNPQINAQAFI